MCILYRRPLLLWHYTICYGISQCCMLWYIMVNVMVYHCVVVSFINDVVATRRFYDVIPQRVNETSIRFCTL